MSTPALTIAPSLSATEGIDVLAHLIAGEDGVPIPLGTAADIEGIVAALASVGATGARNEVVRLPASGDAPARAFVGIGSAEPSADVLRVAAGQVTRLLSGVDSLAIDFPHGSAEEVVAILEGAGLGAYEYTRYRTPSETRKAAVARITAISDVPTSDALAAAVAAVDAVALVRDLANMPPLDLYPSAFADRAVELAAPLPIEVTVWDETRLEADGFGGILGVGMGSTRPPRLVKLVYRPEGAVGHLALVGKGITFDTGGLSLKPPTSMVGMKYDMTGAATALAVIVAAARLESPVALTAWLCLAENMPSGAALRPNDVLTIRGGTTVEVLNTDAEGRLVMADGLVAASEEHPDAIIDIATLTGAAKVALGDRYIAVMGNDDFATTVIEAAERRGESFWRLPLPEEMRSLLNSDIADLTNVKIGNTAGGALVAGIFLKEFVGRVSDDRKARQISWAHLDIAGAAWNDSASGYLVKGPTGVAVRALLELTKSFRSA